MGQQRIVRFALVTPFLVRRDQLVFGVLEFLRVYTLIEEFFE